MSELLKGKKTYLTAAAGGVVMALYLLGVIDADTAAALGGLLGFSAFAALRAGVTKSQR